MIKNTQNITIKYATYEFVEPNHKCRRMTHCHDLTGKQLNKKLEVI